MNYQISMNVSVLLSLPNSLGICLLWLFIFASFRCKNICGPYNNFLQLVHYHYYFWGGIKLFSSETSYEHDANVITNNNKYKKSFFIFLALTYVYKYIKYKTIKYCKYNNCNLITF